MRGFHRDSVGRARLAGADLGALIAEAGIRTPAYVYDLDAIGAETSELERAFDEAPHLVAYAVKANSAGSIVRRIASCGAGADVVSGAELELAIGAGIAPSSIVMSGVAKTDAEIDLAIGRGIHAIQIESIEEIERVHARALSLGRRARASLRINPGIDIDSHVYVATGHDAAKFGIVRADLGDAFSALDRASEFVDAVGISTHVGSMLGDVAPYVSAAAVVCDAARSRSAVGKRPEFVDFGGGFGIDYGAGIIESPSAFVRAGLGVLREHGLEALRMVIEPGRGLVGPYGVLVARVIQGKRSGARRWAMIDAGMNDLLRPALYGAKHRIEPLERLPGGQFWRVVGPVCESADDFGEHPLGDPLPELVVIRDAGAYGYAMASSYNGRSLPAEVFASGGKVVSTHPARGAEAWVSDRLGA